MRYYFELVSTFSAHLLLGVLLVTRFALCRCIFALRLLVALNASHVEGVFLLAGISTRTKLSLGFFVTLAALLFSRLFLVNEVMTNCAILLLLLYKINVLGVVKGHSRLLLLAPVDLNFPFGRLWFVGVR